MLTRKRKRFKKRSKKKKISKKTKIKIRRDLQSIRNGNSQMEDKRNIDKRIKKRIRIRN